MVSPRTILITQITIILLVGYWWYALVWSTAPTGTGEVQVHFFDVGQGDAILIETPNRRQVLIDAGRGIEILNELNSVLPAHDTKIDVLVMTHPDADHIGGFVPVLQRFAVQTIITSFVETNTSVYRKVLEGMAKQEEDGTEVYTITQAQTFTLDDVRFDILWPLGREVQETNAASVVVLATYGDMNVLLTGDANKAVEDRLVKVFGERIRDIEILKAGHHGSKTSTSAKFLNHTAPSAVIYSAAKNSQYGHPHESVIHIVDTYSDQHPDRNLQQYRTSDGTTSFCLKKTSFTECTP